MFSDDWDPETVCRQMPKVELHAHLNGSISEEILSKLEQANGENRPESPVNPGEVNEKIGGTVELAQCFRTFAKIHDVITTPKILHWVTTQVIQEFSSDNVVYLELRTTPKKIHAIPSKDAYIQSVVQAIEDCEDSFFPPIVTKLLISIDRRLSAEEALENVNLAIRWSKEYLDIVVGVDLSGDPTKGSFSSFWPALSKAREHGLRISCHLSEVVNAEEAYQILNFGPERVGHAVKIHAKTGGTEALWNLLKSSKIPVEICLTSNLVTKTVKSLECHHLKFLEAEGMPFIICTDDSGVFRTTLTREYVEMIRLVGVGKDRLLEMCFKSADYIFGDAREKVRIHSIMSNWWEQEFQRNEGRNLDLDWSNTTQKGQGWRASQCMRPVATAGESPPLAAE